MNTCQDCHKRKVYDAKSYGTSYAYFSICYFSLFIYGLFNREMNLAIELIVLLISAILAMVSILNFRILSKIGPLILIVLMLGLGGCNAYAAEPRIKVAPGLFSVGKSATPKQWVLVTSTGNAEILRMEDNKDGTYTITISQPDKVKIRYLPKI